MIFQPLLKLSSTITGGGELSSPSARRRVHALAEIRCRGFIPARRSEDDPPFATFAETLATIVDKVHKFNSPFRPTMNAATGRKPSQDAFEKRLQDHLAQTGANGKNIPDVKAVRNGLDIADLDDIRKRLDVSEEAMERLLHVSARTLQRRRKENSRLTPAESDRLWRLAHIFKRALQAFDQSEHVARAWLTRPSAVLNGESPLDRLDTEPGMREVEDMLTVIDETAAA